MAGGYVIISNSIFGIRSSAKVSLDKTNFYVVHYRLAVLLLSQSIGYMTIGHKHCSFCMRSSCPLRRRLVAG